MASGSDVAAQVSHIVLLNSDFSSMPSVVMEGRRVINNIERSASLFLVKNIFSFVLALISLFFTLTYPFTPSQLSLVSTITIGIPSFVLALEPNESRVKGKFLKNVMYRALPAAITDLVLILGVILFNIAFKIGDNETSTICTVVMGVVGLMMVFKTCQPFNKLRRAMMIVLTAAFGFCVLFMRTLFTLSELSFSHMLILVVISLLAWPGLNLATRSLDGLRDTSFRLFSRKSRKH
jgi:cation-transporting ATPase E